MRETTDARGKFFKDISSRYNTLEVLTQNAHTHRRYTRTHLYARILPVLPHIHDVNDEVKDVYVPS